MSILRDRFHENFIELMPTSYNHFLTEPVNASMFDKADRAKLDSYLTSHEGANAIAYPQVVDCNVDNIIGDIKLNNSSSGSHEAFIDKKEARKIANLTGIHLAALLSDAERLKNLFIRDKKLPFGTIPDDSIVLLDPEIILIVINASREAACADCVIKALCHKKALKEIRKVIGTRLRLPYTGDENKLEL